MIPNVKNIQDKKIHNLICFAQRLFTFLQISAESAKEKIKNAGGTTMLIEKLVETNPEGKGVKIFVG